MQIIPQNQQTFTSENPADFIEERREVDPDAERGELESLARWLDDEIEFTDKDGEA